LKVNRVQINLDFMNESYDNIDEEIGEPTLYEIQEITRNRRTNTV